MAIQTQVNGTVGKGFERVRDAFAANASRTRSKPLPTVPFTCVWIAMG